MIRLKNGKHIINTRHITYIELNEVPDFKRVDLCIYLDTKEAFAIYFNTKESAEKFYNMISLNMERNVLIFDGEKIKNDYDLYTA